MKEVLLVRGTQPLVNVLFRPVIYVGKLKQDIGGGEVYTRRMG